MWRGRTRRRWRSVSSMAFCTLFGAATFPLSRESDTKRSLLSILNILSFQTEENAGSKSTSLFPTPLSVHDLPSHLPASHLHLHPTPNQPSVTSLSQLSSSFAPTPFGRGESLTRFVFVVEDSNSDSGRSSSVEEAFRFSVGAACGWFVEELEGSGWEGRM